MYEAALEMAGGVAAAEALHIGDSMRKDYAPARRPDARAAAGQVPHGRGGGLAAVRRRRAPDLAAAGVAHRRRRGAGDGGVEGARRRS